MRARLPGARSGPDGEGLHRGLHGAALRRHARARPHRPPDAGVGLLRRHHQRQELRRLDAAARGGPLRPRLLCAPPAGVLRPGGPAERQGHHAAAAGHHPRALQLRAHPAGPRRQHRHSERLPAALRRQQGQPLVLPHVPAARRRHQPGPAGGRPDAAAPVGAARRRAVRSDALRLRRRHQRQELRRPDARRRLRRRVRTQQAVPGLPAGRHQTSSEPAGRVSHQDPPLRRPAAAVPPGGASHRQGHEGLSQTQVLTPPRTPGTSMKKGVGWGGAGGKTYAMTRLPQVPGRPSAVLLPICGKCDWPLAVRCVCWHNVNT